MTAPSYRLDGPAGAPILVLVNSLGTSIDLWNAQLPAFTTCFRVLRYELPGHGNSPTPHPAPASIAELGTTLLALLDEFGAESVSLCGLSLGGMVAMWLAAHYPARVDRLVLANTAAHLPPASGWIDRAAAARADGMSSLLGILLDRWFTPGYPIAHPSARDGVAAMLASCDPEGYAGCCLAIATMDQRDDLARITSPTLVIAGAVDPVTPPAIALELSTSIPGAGLVVIPGASHLSNIEQPRTFTSAVLDHLVGTLTERGERARRSVLGDAHVDRTATVGPLRRPFFEYVTRSVWGEIWTRPGLDRRTRSAVTLAALTAVGAWDELALHVHAALRNGLTSEEIGEVLLHTAAYAGVPAANRALSIAETLLGSDLDLSDSAE